MATEATAPSPAGPRTLAVDVGGSGVKAMLLSAAGRPLSERLRVATPHPATPAAVLRTLKKLVAGRVAFDRVSVGFPGVVLDGVVKIAPNLDPSWADFELEPAIRRLFGKPARVLNDAGIQGYGAIEGEGVEVCITLGTGFGFSLFLDGQYVPNIEMGHHPFRKGRTYEEALGAKALARAGRKKWNRTVARAIDQLGRTFNYRVLYVGGGNAARVTIELPGNVKVIDNLAGLLGGVKLWDGRRSG